VQNLNFQKPCRAVPQERLSRAEGEGMAVIGSHASAARVV
jgi:hypothetical protein